jgi:hypothetical protein
MKRDAAASKAKRQALGVTPDVLRDLFNATKATCNSGGGPSRQAVASFLKQYYSTIDLEEFFVLFADYLIGQRPSKNIGANGWLPGVEAELDVQYIMGVSYGHAFADS